MTDSGNVLIGFIYAVVLCAGLWFAFHDKSPDDYYPPCSAQGCEVQR